MEEWKVCRVGKALSFQMPLLDKSRQLLLDASKHRRLHWEEHKLQERKFFQARASLQVKLLQSLLRRRADPFDLHLRVDGPSKIGLPFQNIQEEFLLNAQATFERQNRPKQKRQIQKLLKARLEEDCIHLRLLPM